MFDLVKKDQKNNEISSLQRKIDNLFDNFFDSSLVNQKWANSSLARTFQPRVNISEDEKSYYIEAELAGVKKEDIKLRYDENNTLSISAEKKESQEENKKNYHRIEHFSGSFYRSFQLPENIDRDSIEAKMKDGVLTITLQKTEKNDYKAKEISIS